MSSSSDYYLPANVFYTWLTVERVNEYCLKRQMHTIRFYNNFHQSKNGRQNNISVFVGKKTKGSNIAKTSLLGSSTIWQKPCGFLCFYMCNSILHISTHRTEITCLWNRDLPNAFDLCACLGRGNHKTMFYSVLKLVAQTKEPY